ncbi:MAG: glycerate dehydrogenase [Gammaproteobacteria bacterium]|nr:glycerate dehydrogenase [Gammaproteobacteria bacterium]
MHAVFLDHDTLQLTDLDTSEIDATVDDVTYWPDSAPEEISERIAAAEVVVVNKAKLDREQLTAAKQLRLICLIATGADNIDLVAAKELGIAVANIRDYCTPSVVQHVFALILTLNQRLDIYREKVRTGEWAAAPAFTMLEPVTHELQGKTLGLIGLGVLGRAVASVARAMGMRVIAARLPWRSVSNGGTDGQSAPRLPLESLLQQSDIVSLHCPLTDDTRHIINAEALQLMQPHSLLINTARGGLVDSAALLNALREGGIGGAGIDVLSEEPPVNGDPLLIFESDRLIVTPHMAWGAVEARQRALDQTLDNIRAFRAGAELNRLV